MPLVLALAGCWDDRGSCELWMKKLEQGEEASTATKQLADNRCVQARATLLAHFADPNLGADVLTALVALGRSPEAEAAVRKALGKGETAVVAAKQVTAWALASAEPELRAALADQTLSVHHSELLEAALKVAPAERWVGTLARELGDEGRTMERALATLATVDWAAVPEAERGQAALALAELGSRDNALPERAGAALHELGRLPKTSLPDAAALVTRASAGNREALLGLYCLEVAEVNATARALCDRERLEPGVRALALAIEGRTGDVKARVAAAPPEDEVAIGLALAGGAAIVPELEARVAAEKGAARAAFARALGLALPAERLADWEADLRKSPSLLLRGIPDEPAVAAVLALARRCTADEACYAAAIEASLPALGRLDAELAAAKAALKEAEDKAQAAVAADAARAQELAKATGEGVAAAKQELEAIAAKRDAIYAGVGQASRQVAELSAAPLAVTYALRRLSDHRQASAAARSLLEACHGTACAALRGWAAVALEAPPLACLLETPPAAVAKDPR